MTPVEATILRLRWETNAAVLAIDALYADWTSGTYNTDQGGVLSDALERETMRLCEKGKAAQQLADALVAWQLRFGRES